MSSVSLSAFHRTTMTVLHSSQQAILDSHLKSVGIVFTQIVSSEMNEKEVQLLPRNKQGGDRQEENMFLGLFRPCVVFPGSGCKSISHTHAGKFEWTIHSNYDFFVC